MNTKNKVRVFFDNRSLVVAVLAMIVLTSNAGQTIDRKVDWESFLARHDMIWNKFPGKWYNAPFMGNGMMGIQLRKTANDTIHIDVGRGDVEMHSQKRYRVPIGHFDWKIKQPLKRCAWRLRLYDAITDGTMTCKDGGKIKFRSFVHATRDLILLEASGSASFTFVWVPEKPINPRRVKKKLFKDFIPPSPPTIKVQGNVNLCIQAFDKGELTMPDAKDTWATVSAWTIVKKGGVSKLLLTVKHASSEKKAIQQALAELSSVQDKSFDALFAEHRKWWHGYYPQSFVSFTDPVWEGFYWIQMYKLASATRADGMLVDNQGPWLQPTPWPAAWWNLNVQLTYWPVYTANRLSLGESLVGNLDDHFDQLVKNVKPKYRSDSAGIGRSAGQNLYSPVREMGRGSEVGNLLWACHNYWLHCRYAADDDRLKNKFYPLLRRCVNYYLHFLVKDDKNVYHIPKTFSPEYTFARGSDTNYDLALLKWGLGIIVDTAVKAKIDEPRLKEYRNVLRNLVSYPQDENGMMIAANVPFAHGHRHFSHLLMFYPLYLMTVETPGTKELVKRSVSHWHSLGKSQGYSLTGASLMFSAMGDGENALKYLNGLKKFFRPNTLYRESGPVIETPLSGAQAIQNMLLQSWGGVIRVFPAVPEKWRDVTFDDLRTEDAFLISAERRNGMTNWVRIKSLAGKPCRIRCGMTGRIRSTTGATVKTLSNGTIELTLAKGEETVLTNDSTKKSFVIDLVPGSEKKGSTFGIR